MTIEVKEQTAAYHAEFERLEAQCTQDGLSWLMPIRKAAIARFDELGFPGTRDEDWRYTSLAPIANTAFAFAGASEHATTADQIQDLVFDDRECSRLVFVDGHFTEELSAVGALPSGTQIGSVAEALLQRNELLERHLARYANGQSNAMAALNTALFRDGAFVYLPKGTVLETPVHVIFVTTGSAQPLALNPRNLIIADTDSQLRVVESYVGTGRGPYWDNAVTELVAAENARIDHSKVIREGDGAFHIATFQIQQQRNSNVTSSTVSLGGELIRNNITTVLDGEGCHCFLNGLNMLSGSQHVDNHLLVEHAQPHCDSREFFKGIYDQQAHGVFSGRIRVHQDAQKTDAKQTNMSLLLSREALADSKPQLEIFADDVKCTHGATVGQVDEDAIFYMRTRGIPEAAARSLLIYAFANECLEHITLEPLRTHLQKLLLGRLPEGELLEETR